MSKPQSFTVGGVDGCRSGWLVAKAESKLLGELYCLELKETLVAHDFEQVLSETCDCLLVCIDIPVGLSDKNSRECDIEARRVLGMPRAGSVFPTPVRACLSAKDYRAASKISFDTSGRKLNKQSFGLLEKIRQVDDLMTMKLQKRLREIHPEVSFWALNNKKPMRHSKKKPAGRKEHVQLLCEFFSDIEEIVDQPRVRKEAAADDILDALAASWTANQAVIGKCKTLPARPGLDSKALRMEILCPDR